jgi:site-specific DNA-methyltransferase (adenine-specific)
VTSWSIHHGNCLEWLQTLPDKSVDHVITDPPYSEHVHSKHMVRGSLTEFGIRRELGYAPITTDLMDGVAEQIARVVRRWVLVFCDFEIAHQWSDAFCRHGLEHVRAGIWVKQAAAPQFTGDRPAAGFEFVLICHPKGRKRWNGGGSQAVWTHTVVNHCNRHINERLRRGQKPIALMWELVELFTDSGELVIDPFAGAATTGLAAMRLGRRFAGCELDAECAKTARERLVAEQLDSSLQALRKGQLALFGCSTSMT